MVMLILGLHALIFSSTFCILLGVYLFCYIHSPSKAFVYNHR